MSERTTMHEAPVSTSGPISPGNGRVIALACLRLAAGLVLICLAAVVTCCVVATLALLVGYLQVGRDGLLDFYQELRFNFRLKTLLGALTVGALYLSVIAAVVAAAVIRDGSAWRARLAFGRIHGRRRTVLAICGTTLAYAVVATLVTTLGQDHRVVLSGSTDFALLGTISANLVLLAPIAEETLFRGWLYTGLRRFAGFWPSFVIVAAAFAAIHLGIGQRRMLLVVPLAVALGVLREVTGSIKPTIALHIVYNLAIVAITLLEI